MALRVLPRPGRPVRLTRGGALLVDLLVALENRGRGLPIARLGMKLEALLGRPVQLVSLAEAESSPSVLAEAGRDGRVVVDRDRTWERLRREEEALIQRAKASDAELQAAARETLRHFAR